jgi:hypothetical protein
MFNLETILSIAQRSHSLIPSIISHTQSTMLTLSSMKLEGLPNNYSSSVVGAVYSSTHGSTFSTSERKAASCAVLHHQQHLKDHSNTRKPSGLHPWYISLNRFGKVPLQEQQEVYQLHKETLHDLFNSVHSFFIYIKTTHTIFFAQITTLDNIDGGLTLLLRCPGYSVQEDLAAEKITANTYVSPRELKKGGKEMSKQVALILQAFGAELAMPHLCCFHACCNVEGLNAAAPPSMCLQLKYFVQTYDVG